MYKILGKSFCHKFAECSHKFAESMYNVFVNIFMRKFIAFIFANLHPSMDGSFLAQFKRRRFPIVRGTDLEQLRPCCFDSRNAYGSKA